MSATAVLTDAFEVSDVTGQNVRRVGRPPEGTRVDAFVREMTRLMNLTPTNSANQQVVYHARHDRIGRHLLGSEEVNEVVQPGDRLFLHPNVDAGIWLSCTSVTAS